MTTSRLHETILALYRGCRDRPAPEFKEWAMETARMAVAFDSGIWVTSDIVSDDFRSVYLYQQPAEMMENYSKTMRLSGDFLAQAVISNPGRTVRVSEIIPRREFVKLPCYTQHCHPYGMEDALSTSNISPITSITTFIAFYRAVPDAPFSESDRQTNELLVPHMIEAMRINLFSFLHGAKVLEGGAFAICDPTGMLYETTPTFPIVMRDACPTWIGPRLPLPFEAFEKQQSVRWSHDGIMFEANPCRDLFLVSAARENMLDRLSSRQREVAIMLARGKRYKDIARELAISPATVTKHVNQIHARLEIGGREDLIRLFSAVPARPS